MSHAIAWITFGQVPIRLSPQVLDLEIQLFESFPVIKLILFQKIDGRYLWSHLISSLEQNTSTSHLSAFF